MSLASNLTQSVYGPYLKLLEYAAPHGGYPARWSGSVLYVCHETFTRDRIPTCRVRYQGVVEVLSAEWLDRNGHWHFWKFRIDLELISEEQQVWYGLQVGNDELDIWWSFFVPGAEEGWHLAAYSCSGFSHNTKESDWTHEDGDHPMVKHLMTLHKTKRRIHACLGGGDQLYNDGLFLLETMEKWLEIRDRSERLSMPFDSDMESVLTDFYFTHYCEHFDVWSLKEMCATIPNVMLWDDHDIFDGWGSYPEDMMAAPVFQGIFLTARRFYLLFQHHTTMELIHQGRSDLFLGAGKTPGLSFLKLMGPEVAVLGVDIRSERTKSLILCEESWKQIFERVVNLPGSVRHLIVVFTVPIVYPHVPIAEALLSLISIMNRISVLNAVLVKTNIVSSKTFDEPELLDDLVDHWTSPHHLEERKFVVESFQKIARHHDWRISFLSGDVHCAGLGRFYSFPKPEFFEDDPNFMPQIITSAIINEPPPPSAVSLMHSFDFAGNRVNSETREKMVRLFKHRFPSQHKVLPRRNFITIESLPDQKLKIIFFIENEDHMDQTPLDFPVFVPPLNRKYSDHGRGGYFNFGETWRQMSRFIRSFGWKWGTTETPRREALSLSRDRNLQRSDRGD